MRYMHAHRLDKETKATKSSLVNICTNTMALSSSRAEGYISTGSIRICLLIKVRLLLKGFSEMDNESSSPALTFLQLLQSNVVLK